MIRVRWPVGDAPWSHLLQLLQLQLQQPLLLLLLGTAIWGFVVDGCHDAGGLYGLCASTVLCCTCTVRLIIPFFFIFSPLVLSFIEQEKGKE